MFKFEKHDVEDGRRQLHYRGVIRFQLVVIHLLSNPDCSFISENRSTDFTMQLAKLPFQILVFLFLGVLWGINHLPLPLAFRWEDSFQVESKFLRLLIGSKFLNRILFFLLILGTPGSPRGSFLVGLRDYMGVLGYNLGWTFARQAPYLLYCLSGSLTCFFITSNFFT